MRLLGFRDLGFQVLGFFKTLSPKTLGAVIAYSLFTPLLRISERRAAAERMLRPFRVAAEENNAAILSHSIREPPGDPSFRKLPWLCSCQGLITIIILAIFSSAASTYGSP